MKRTALLLLTLTLVLVITGCNEASGNRVNNENSKNNGTTDAVVVSTNDTKPAVPVSTEAAPITNTNAEQLAPVPETNNTNTTIDRDTAINTALNDAGLTKDSVFDLDAELDKERNGTYWEVDFETRDREYSYDINAYTGEIVRIENERND